MHEHNWLAIAIAAIAAFLIGGLWYSPSCVLLRDGVRHGDVHQPSRAGDAEGGQANMYSIKPIRAYFIDTGYQLVDMLAMGAILGAWR